MKKSVLTFLFLALMACSLVAGSLWAQQGRQKKGPDANRYQVKDGETDKPKEEKIRPLPGDPKLVKLHEAFVLSAEKLAKEYARDGKVEQARTCYEEILHLVPSYTPARTAMGDIREHEAKANTKKMKVFANKDWQDAGITVMKGRPITIHAEGVWTFKLEFKQLGPAGVEIPEALRDFNLGSLVGVVSESDPNAKDAKPFLVGNSAHFNAEQNGRLYLRMFDSDVEDNTGELSVEITGTFGK